MWRLSCSTSSRLDFLASVVLVHEQSALKTETSAASSFPEHYLETARTLRYLYLCPNTHHDFHHTDNRQRSDGRTYQVRKESVFIEGVHCLCRLWHLLAEVIAFVTPCCGGLRSGFLSDWVSLSCSKIAFGQLTNGTRSSRALLRKTAIGKNGNGERRFNEGDYCINTNVFTTGIIVSDGGLG
jgi:hypothetical protein